MLLLATGLLIKLNEFKTHNELKSVFDLGRPKKSESLPRRTKTSGTPQGSPRAHKSSQRRFRGTDPIYTNSRSTTQRTSFADFQANVQKLNDRIAQYPACVRQSVADRYIHLRRPALIGREGVARHNTMATQSATNIIFVIKHDELFNRARRKDNIRMHV